MTKITRIVSLPTEIPKEGVDTHIEFRRKSFIAWAWLLSLADSLRAIIPQMNAMSVELNGKATQVHTDTSKAASYALRAESVVIPTNVTYSEESIDEMLASVANIALTTRMRQNKIKIQGWIG